MPDVPFFYFIGIGDVGGGGGGGGYISSSSRSSSSGSSTGVLISP